MRVMAMFLFDATFLCKNSWKSRGKAHHVVVNTLYFATIPFFRIEGTGTAAVDNELIKEIQVAPDKILVKVNPDEISDATANVIFDTYKILDFNLGREYLHYQVELDDLVTDLAYFTSLDFLRDLCHEYDLIGVLFAQAPPGNPYISMMLGNWYPFPIKKPEGIMYQELILMGRFSSNYFIKLQQFIGDDLTEQFENTIATFRDNVLEPLNKQSQLDEKQSHLILQQARNLTTILGDYLHDLDDRYRHLLEMITPVTLKESLVNELEEHVTYYYRENDLTANPRTILTLDAQNVAIFIKKAIESFFSS